MADNVKIRCGTLEYAAFKEALHYVNETLAKMMAGDGEGGDRPFRGQDHRGKDKKAGKDTG